MLINVNAISEFKRNFLKKWLLDHEDRLVAFVTKFKAVLQSFVSFC